MNASRFSHALSNGISRRTFLRRSLATTGVAMLPQIVPTAVFGAEGTIAPSNRVTIGLIGKGAMGGGHLSRVAYDSGFQLVAICDVDQTRREAGQKLVDEIYAATQP